MWPIFKTEMFIHQSKVLAGMVELLRPFVHITDRSNDGLTQLLLYGDQDLSYDLNKNILELTLCFIHKTVAMTRIDPPNFSYTQNNHHIRSRKCSFAL